MKKEEEKKIEQERLLKLEEAKKAKEKALLDEEAAKNAKEAYQKYLKDQQEREKFIEDMSKPNAYKVQVN